MCHAIIAKDYKPFQKQQEVLSAFVATLVSLESCCCAHGLSICCCSDSPVLIGFLSVWPFFSLRGLPQRKCYSF